MRLWEILLLLGGAGAIGAGAYLLFHKPAAEGAAKSTTPPDHTNAQPQTTGAQANGGGAASWLNGIGSVLSGGAQLANSLGVSHWGK